MMQRLILLVVLLCVLASVHAHAYEWRDCLDDGGDCDRDAGCIRWQNITSSPDPVVRGGKPQTVSKSGIWSGKEDIRALDVRFEQFYKLPYVDKWVPFLKIKVDFCKDYGGVCPIAAGSSFTESKAHPPLNRMTPTGWYRSLQTYYLPESNGRYVGCAVLDVEYVAAAHNEQEEKKAKKKNSMAKVWTW